MKKIVKSGKEVVVFAGRGLSAAVLIPGFAENPWKTGRYWYSERLQGISLGGLWTVFL